MYEICGTEKRKHRHLRKIYRNQDASYSPLQRLSEVLKFSNFSFSNSSCFFIVIFNSNKIFLIPNSYAMCNEEMKKSRSVFQILAIPIEIFGVTENFSFYYFL